MRRCFIVLTPDSDFVYSFMNTTLLIQIMICQVPTIVTYAGVDIDKRPTNMQKQFKLTG